MSIKKSLNELEVEKEQSVRTDLAVEAHEIRQKEQKDKAAQQDYGDGVKVEYDGNEDIKVTRVRIISKAGERSLGKPMGNYITLEAPGLKENSRDLYENTCRVMAKELEKLININPDDTVLVVGLGNWNITPDALGPRVSRFLMVTRHLHKYLPEEVDDGVRPVCAIAPGVLGITGIETGDIVKGVVEKVKPALVIAIDALASRKMSRINTTIQIADTGISPGSGVGNKRMDLSKYTLGVPVVAIGVPTVVDAATMANDTIDLVLDSMIANAEEGTEFYKMLKSINKEEKYGMIKEILDPYVGNLIVTPKEMDEVIDRVSKVIANGINLSLHKNIDIDDVDRFLR